MASALVPCHTTLGLDPHTDNHDSDGKGGFPPLNTYYEVCTALSSSSALSHLVQGHSMARDRVLGLLSPK